MKVFISSDIEGVNGMTDWVEAEKGRPEYGMFVQRQDRALAPISEGLHDSDPALTAPFWRAITAERGRMGLPCATPWSRRRSFI